MNKKITIKDSFGNLITFETIKDFKAWKRKEKENILFDLKSRRAALAGLYSVREEETLKSKYHKLYDDLINYLYKNTNKSFRKKEKNLFIILDMYRESFKVYSIGEIRHLISKTFILIDQFENLNKFENVNILEF